MRENREIKGEGPSTKMDQKSSMYFMSTELLLQLLQTYLEKKQNSFQDHIESLKC